MNAKLWLAAFSVSIAVVLPASGEPRSRDSRNDGRSDHLSSLERVAAFLGPFGLQNFSPHYIQALYTFLEAEKRYQLGDYEGAKQVLDVLWFFHPPGGADWGALPQKPFGINIGSPPCYYGLRMLSDMTDWRLASNVTGSEAPRTAKLTVLVIGGTAGIEPTTTAELSNGTGVFVEHKIDPTLEKNSYAIVHQSLRLFREYAFAMTEGGLNVEVEILPLPRVSLPVHAHMSGSAAYAGLVDAAEVWESVPIQVQKETDWWWILYPSHVPEQYPAFANTAFITGGMGTGPDHSSPFFIIDDRWLVRKPPHIGTGPYTTLEREAYLPQWLQHEFFHHLFRSWPEFGLEATSHQWFNLSSWPPDFVGTYEADYYHEALTKRLQSATPSLKAGLRYATIGARYSQLTIADVLGTYHRKPVQNAWHKGDIAWDGTDTTLSWQNTASFEWNLYPHIADGVLLTGPDCPYYNVPKGKQFQIILKRDELGDLTTELDGFGFNGELYTKQ